MLFSFCFQPNIKKDTGTLGIDSRKLGARYSLRRFSLRDTRLTTAE